MACGFTAVDASAAVPLFVAGPAYDAATTTGYGVPAVPYAPGNAAGAGGVFGAGRIVNGTSQGQRAFRFDATGTLAELGGLGTDASGVAFDYPHAMNLAGVSVGTAGKFDGNHTDLGSRAVRWNAGTTAATELGILGVDSLGRSFAGAYGMNASGTAVGYASKPINLAGINVNSRAVRWDANSTTATELGVLNTDPAGRTVSAAYVVNASDTAAGHARLWNGGAELGDRPVRWAANGTAATALDVLGTDANGVTNGYVYGISSSGVTAGTLERYNSSGVPLGTRAVRWDASGTDVTELAGLGTPTSGVTYTGVNAMSASGDAVGYAEKYNVGARWRGTRAVRWNANSSAVTELGTLGTRSDGFADSTALAINTSGLTVGSSSTFDPIDNHTGSHAVLWGASGVAIDLNRLLSTENQAHWRLEQANAISDANWVVGLGFYDPDGPSGPANVYARAFTIKLGFGGDANFDDKVDFNDFLVLQNNFNHTDTTFAEGDFNYDGITDFNDFLVLQNTFGSTRNGGTAAVSASEVTALNAFAAVVPEPTVMMVAIGAAGMGMRRRRH